MSKKISTSIPQDLLENFDETIKRVGYKSRSKAVQDAMQSLITDSKLMYGKTGIGVGAVAMTYDHSAKGLEDELTKLQHHYKETISSSMHIHLGNLCLQIIAVKGEISEIQRLVQEIRTKRGVKQVKPVTFTP